MSEIDWIKASREFPIWIEELGFKTSGDGWHREEEDRYVDEDGRFWEKSWEGIHFIVRRRPEVYTCTGKGGSYELIAAEERLQVLDEMVFGAIGADRNGSNTTAFILCGLLYDAGYRKVGQ